MIKMIHAFLLLISLGVFANAAPEWRVLSGEYKSYRRMGDLVEAEYEQLHPDGSVTRREASGDVTKGLTYNNFRIDPDGTVHTLEAPRPAGYQDRLGGHTRYPGEGAGVSRWRPDTPRDVKISRDPVKDFFKDLFTW